MTKKEYNELLGHSTKFSNEDKNFSRLVYITSGVGFIAGMILMSVILSLVLK